ncbi:MAG: hypothetical protein HGA55_08055, partial [Methanoregulaceae archaeon]|nr:hypothetical protein [Methanoregulaceae archaeon]
MWRSLASVAIVVAILGMALVLGLGLADPSTGDGNGLKKFNSTAELKAFLKENQAENAGGGGRGSSWRPLSAPMMNAQEDAATGSAMPLPSSKAFDGSAGEYSTTNIQVRGVDEADFVKNDGEYLYLISGERLVIIDAWPAEQAGIVSETDLSGQPVELFLSGNRLVVFTGDNEQTLVKPGTSVVPVPYYHQVTVATVYDISDREDPEIERTLTFPGNYIDSRMIGDYVYAVTSDPVQWIGPEPAIPLVKDGGKEIMPPIYYFDGPYGSYVYNTISSFNLKNDQSPEAETFLSGYSTTLYVSSKNLYVAYQKQIPYTRWEVIHPLAMEESSVSENPREGTIIHRFGINRGEIDYAATGDVPGHLLNQFSMDEDSGNLRVATTVDGWNSR